MLKPSKFVKIRVATPVSHAEKIRKALAAAGAGRQGRYDHCSGSWMQIGRFRPLAGANPTIGQVGKIEKVEEELVETLCDIARVKKVISAVKKVHPYEEPAIDIFSTLRID